MVTVSGSADGGLHRAVARVLHGERVWGGLEVWPSRNAVVRYRLTVYRPGTSAAERQAERLWRAWPAIAGATGVAEFAALSAVGQVLRALLVVAAVSVAGSVTVAVLTRRRARPIRVTAARLQAGGGAVGLYREVASAVAYLEAADDGLRAGRLTSAQHELAWATVWRMLGGPD